VTKEEQQAIVLDQLRAGDSLSSICRLDGLPNRCTVQRWQDDDATFDAAVTRAREVGFEARADRAVEAAKAATDASLARLAFDAERWYLGKLSNAFSDNKAQKHEVSLNLANALDALPDG